MTDAELVARYQAGLPVEGLCHPPRLYRALRAAGVKPNRKGPQERHLEAAELRRQGLTYTDIGARLGISKEVARYWVQAIAKADEPAPGRGKWSRA